MSIMIDPYRMIVVNLIASLLLIIGVFSYLKLSHKKINLFALLILISILPIISVFRKGVYESGDFIFHIYHAMDFYDALIEGILIPSWSAGLNSGFGHPVFTFIYIVPYYLMSFLHFLGFTFIFSERLVLTGAFIGSGISMWFLLKKLTQNNLAAFAGSVLYLFAPYHLIDLHFRVAIAESLAFTITPLIFYLILKIKDKPKVIYFAWTGLLFGLLFLTHPAMFVIYSGIFFLYVCYQTITKQTSKSFITTFLGSFAVGMAISSFAWIPRFTLTKLTQGSLLLNYPIQFVDPNDLLFSPWRLGFLFQGPYGQLSFVIGYGGIFILLLSSYVILKKKKKNKHFSDMLFWAFISLSTVFIMLPFSKIIWETFTFLNLMQFSYRFLHPLAFCVAILTSYLVLLYSNKKNLIYVFLLLSISYTMLNWGNRGTLPSIDDAWIRNNLPNGTKQGEKMIEATPLWWNTEKDFLSPAKTHLEIVNGNAEIKEFKRTTTRHIYGVNASEPTTLVENTLYFPDWKITVDGKNVPIDYKNSKYNARMVFNVPKGLHFIEAKYDDIRPIKIAKRISGTLVLTIVIYLVLYYTSHVMELIFNKLHKPTKKK